MKGLQRKWGGRATGSVATGAARLAFIAVVVMLLSVMWIMPVMAEGCGGLDINAEISNDSLEVFSDRIIEYSWDIEKIALQEKVTIKKGESAKIDYKIIATRNLESDDVYVYVLGEVIVSTDAETQTTSGLEIYLKVVDSDNVTVLPPEPINFDEEEAGKGEKSYPFWLVFITDKMPGTVYKVVIDNIVTDNACDAITGIGSYESFELPSVEGTYEFNDKAHIEDSIAPITGFAFSYLGGKNGWELSDSDEISYSVTVKNESAEDGKCFDLINTATLTMKTSEEQFEIEDWSISAKHEEEGYFDTVSDSAKVKICTPEKEVPAPAPAQVTTKKAAALPHTGMNDVALLISIVLGVIGAAFLVLSYTSFGKKLMVLGSKVE